MFSHETLKLISHLLQEHILDEKSLENMKTKTKEKNIKDLFTFIDKDGNGEITLLDVN